VSYCVLFAICIELGHNSLGLRSSIGDLFGDIVGVYDLLDVGDLSRCDTNIEPIIPLFFLIGKAFLFL
jgi:hypothetical protein